MKRTHRAINVIFGMAGLAGLVMLIIAGTFFLRSIDPVGLVPGTSQTAPSLPGILDEEFVTITFASLESSRPLIETLIDEFQLQNPGIKVQFVAASEVTFQDTQVLASTADTILLPFSLPVDAGSYFRDLQPLTLTDATFERDDFWPGLLEACQDAERRLVGLPLRGHVWGVFFDPGAFDQAGLTHPAPGWTWDDFQRYAVELAIPNSDPPRYGFVDNLHLSTSILKPLVEAQLERAAGLPEADLGQMLEQELNWYLDLVRSKSIYPVGGISGEGLNQEAWENLFLQDSPPAMWVGNLGQVMPGASSGFSPSSPLSGLALSRYSFAPFPGGLDGQASKTSPVYSSCAVISAGSRYPRASWTWINFLSHQRLVENQGLGEQLLRIPGRQSVTDSSGFWEVLGKDSQAAVRFALDHAWPGYRRYSQRISGVHDALVQSISNNTDLASTLTSRLLQPADETPSSSTSPEIYVATPQPTTPAGFSSVRFFFLGLNENEKLAVSNLAAAFNQANPGSSVRVQFNYELREDLNFVRGFSEQFDCFSWYAPIWTGSANTEDMLPLNPFFEGESPEFIQDFYPEQLNIYRFEGQLYGLPASSQPEVIFYNANLLRSRGISLPDKDWTYQDFLNMATSAASVDIQDQTYGFLFEEWEGLLDDLSGVRLVDSEDPSQPQARFDSPEVIQHLRWLAELKNSGVLLVKYDTSVQPALDAFINGRLAFWPALAGDPFSPYFSEVVNPSYEIGVAPLPKPPSQGKYGGSPTLRGYFISPQSGDPQLCWNWIKYLSQQPSVMDGVPSRRSVAESPAWINHVGQDYSDVYRQALTQYEPTIYNPLEGPYGHWWHTAVVAAVRGENIEPLASELQGKADRYLDCIAPVDKTRLAWDELLDHVRSCAREADPQGNW
jgi:ABC-type glycerol-3-phosphate transport system substrate-binding protein